MLLLPFAVSATLVTVNEIERVSIEVTDQSPAVREKAFQQALNEMLVRLSGTRQVLQTPAAQKLSAASYVQKYLYANIAPVADATVATESATINPQLVLQIDFDVPALQKWLREAGQLVWGVRRPAILLWLAVETQEQRYLLSADSADMVKAAVATAAQQRGLPITYPLLDLHDQQQIEFADIRAGFVEPLKASAQRYNSSVILAGYLRQEADYYTIQWTAYYADQQQRWTTESPELKKIMAFGMNNLADWLAAEYAVSTQNSQLSTIYITVAAVTSLQDYAYLMQELSQPLFVEFVTPVKITQKQVQYQIGSWSDVATLERALTLTQRLRPASSPEETAGRPPIPGAPLNSRRSDLYYVLDPVGSNE